MSCGPSHSAPVRSRGQIKCAASFWAARFIFYWRTARRSTEEITETKRRRGLGSFSPVHSGKEHVEAALTTLAPDSRHIVAFYLSSTTSRAADSSLKRRVLALRWAAATRFLARWGILPRLCPHLEEDGMSWTDERVELLKKLWSDGLSASQIAAELGGITRNAVIGKVHRLGL